MVLYSERERETDQLYEIKLRSTWHPLASHDESYLLNSHLCQPAILLLHTHISHLALALSLSLFLHNLFMVVIHDKFLIGSFHYI